MGLARNFGTLVSSSSSMSVPLFVADSFTSVGYSGNPAAVCLDEAGLSERQMRAIAAEMNLSETAFVRQLPAGGSFAASLTHHNAALVPRRWSTKLLRKPMWVRVLRS